MGAHNFHHQEHGETPDEAYSSAVNDALHYSGHNPYNGTISTTNGFIVINREEGETIDEWASRVLDDRRINKWDACACTPDPEKEKLWHFAGWAAC